MLSFPTIRGRKGGGTNYQSKNRTQHSSPPRTCVEKLPEAKKGRKSGLGCTKNSRDASACAESFKVAQASAGGALLKRLRGGTLVISLLGVGGWAPFCAAAEWRR